VNVTQCSAPILSLSVNNNNRITNSGFSYDASGDLTSDGVNNYTWNAEALMASANSTNYTYDGDRKRVEKSNGTLYWYGPSGEILEETDLSGNLRHDYIYFAGKRLARQDGTGATTVYYYFQDHLGTGLMMVDGWGHVQQQSVYYPFGGERVITNNVANNYKFTGLERDSETGLDHTLNRQYSSTVGRWLSPDPVRGCVVNPQKFDRYAYVVNNPLSLVDPLGLDDGCTENPDGTIDCPPIQVTSSAPAPGDDTGPGSTLWDLEFPDWGGSPGQPLIYGGGRARGGGGGDGGGGGGDSGRCTATPPPYAGFPVNAYPAGNLCAGQSDHPYFWWSWTCEGDRDCCLTKENQASKDCDELGPGFFLEDQPGSVAKYANCCGPKPRPRRAPPPTPPPPRPPRHRE
jgi:RHS repeat-associated protein